MKRKKEKLPAELWDKMHYLFRDFNDRMVHLELYYDFVPDIDALKKVIICFFEKAPVFHSSFTDNPFSPYWTVHDYDINDVLTVEYTDEAQKRADEFLVQYIPPESELQMKFALFISGEKSILCIVENHMCMDGGDFKYFIRSLCSAYTRLVDEGISPVELRTGTRSFDKVYEDYTYVEKRMAKNLYKNVCAKDKHCFPLTPVSIRDEPFIVKRKIDGDTFLRLKAVGKEHGATVNDMLLAAYFFSLYEIGGFGENECLTVSCAVDLRRHIHDLSDEGMTNHTAFMQCSVPQRGHDIFETLKYAVQSSEKFKNDKFMGLYGLPLLNLGYSILPHALSEEIIKIGYSNPLIAMSNIGILDCAALSLCGHEPTDGFMTGAVKYKPYVLLSATTMRNVVTLSMCVKGNEEDRAITEKFFGILEKNIKTLTSARI